jgi:GDP-L-fucose synthase
MQIMELARQVAAVTGFSGRIGLDPSYPDGAPQKLLDVSRITALGWQARTPLDEGLRQAYDWFCRSPWAQKP